jgi:hypothetical protein
MQNTNQKKRPYRLKALELQKIYIYIFLWNKKKFTNVPKVKDTNSFLHEIEARTILEYNLN